MSEIEELKVHIESLETHVARLEGILYVLLEQLEAGTIEESAASIREQLPRIELQRAAHPIRTSKFLRYGARPTRWSAIHNRSL